MAAEGWGFFYLLVCAAVPSALFSTYPVFLFIANNHFAPPNHLIIQPQPILITSGLGPNRWRSAQQSHAHWRLKNVRGKRRAVRIELHPQISRIRDPTDLIAGIEHHHLRYKSYKYGPLCHFCSILPLFFSSHHSTLFNRRSAAPLHPISASIPSRRFPRGGFTPPLRFLISDRCYPISVTSQDDLGTLRFVPHRQHISIRITKMKSRSARKRKHFLGNSPACLPHPPLGSAKIVHVNDD